PVPPPAHNIIWKTNGAIPTGKTDLAIICVDGGQKPSRIDYDWKNKKGQVICRDFVNVQCDTTDDYDYSGCDLDIDTTIVSVSCGNLVNVQPVFDGTPSYIKYTIYDSVGTELFTAYNTPQYSFTLPGPGLYYGVVEASCDGGDDQGGDEDEDVFEINNLAPVADFSLESVCSCANGVAQRSVSSQDYSNGDGLLSYLWKVTDVATGNITTYTIDQPSFVLDSRKNYTVDLTVTDSKGCTSLKTAQINSISSSNCKPKFDWYYSWCDSCKKGSSVDVTVYFENLSENSNCSLPLKYNWDFGDQQTSTLDNPQHKYKVPCGGKDYTVSLTMTLGTPGDSGYCKSEWHANITINNIKPTVTVKICCDGLVFFHTDAVEGKWSTPSSLGIPKWPAVSKHIYNLLGFQVGQNYRQYYDNPGTYSVTITDAISDDHNRCPVGTSFTINSIECFNRNVKKCSTDVVGGVSVKLKFKALALPLIHRMKSKIKTIGFKKAKEISTDFSGTINKKGADGCYCTPQPVSANSNLITNKRKAKAKTSTNGRFRIGMDKATANFYIKTKSGATMTWQLKLGYPPCDHPWFLFY
ncbi:MAG: PKD domain-containing protein, partial [Bacteroidota bacterium]